MTLPRPLVHDLPSTLPFFGLTLHITPTNRNRHTERSAPMTIQYSISARHNFAFVETEGS